jgi:predicted DNA-binding transcriptional regulator AlpA
MKEQPILLTDTEVSKILRQSRQTLANLRSVGQGCPFIRLGRSIRYLESDVQEYIKKSRVPTSED